MQVMGRVGSGESLLEAEALRKQLRQRSIHELVRVSSDSRGVCVCVCVCVFVCVQEHRQLEQLSK
jgi:hypothetical protein